MKFMPYRLQTLDFFNNFEFYLYTCIYDKIIMMALLFPPLFPSTFPFSRSKLFGRILQIYPLVRTSFFFSLQFLFFFVYLADWFDRKWQSQRLNRAVLQLLYQTAYEHTDSHTFLIFHVKLIEILLLIKNQEMYSLSNDLITK